MTVLAPFGRVLSQRLGGRSNHLVTRLYTQPSLTRTSCCSNDGISSSPWPCSRSPHTRVRSFIGSRSYATSTSTTTQTARPAGRPKAHTGRNATKKSPTTKSTSTKRAAADQKKGEKTPVKKTKAKAKKKATKIKAKPKKRELSEAGLKRQEHTRKQKRVAELKAKALLDEPKKLIENTWVLFSNQDVEKSSSLAERREHVKELGEKYKHITPAEREALNHVTIENKRKNEAAYKKWVSTFTPQQIKEANQARSQLFDLQAPAAGKNRRYLKLIKDDRRVKQPRSAYLLFSVDRFASGDFRSVAIPEAARLIGQEWKALASLERAPFEDRAKQDRGRYIEEHTTVYGVPPSQISGR